MKLKELMLSLSEEMAELGLAVHLPTLDETTDYNQLAPQERSIEKNRLILIHLQKIRDSDAVLIVNETLKEVEGYIGANSFLEMGFALSLGKKVFLYRRPSNQHHIDEVLGMFPVILDGDISKLLSVAKIPQQ